MTTHTGLLDLSTTLHTVPVVVCGGCGTHAVRSATQALAGLLPHGWTSHYDWQSRTDKAHCPTCKLSEPALPEEQHMTHDNTEHIRRNMVAANNAVAVALTAHNISHREVLEKDYGIGNVWDTAGLTERFEVLGFMAPFAVVRDRATSKKGSVEFIHSPRLYFNWVEDRR